jgi:hypothetical protein
MGPSPGPAPAAHTLARTVSASRSSWRTCPKVNARKKVPRVEGHDPVAQHPAGGATAQHVGVVDAAPTRQHRMDQGQQLAAGPVRASPLAQVDQRIGGLLDAQPLGQGGRQQQPGVGDGVGVIEAGVELVQGVAGSHRESALLIG